MTNFITARSELVIAWHKQSDWKTMNSLTVADKSQTYAHYRGKPSDEFTRLFASFGL